MVMSSEYISQAEAALVLGVSTAAMIDISRRQGLLRRYERDGHVWYRLQDILAFQRQRRAAGRAKPGPVSSRDLLRRRNLVMT